MKVHPITRLTNHPNLLALITILVVALAYFQPIWTNKMIPFPGHLVASFFSPWKEQSWPGYPTGVPRKDLLGFDTVRMMGPWRHFITQQLKQNRLPTWNPHQFAGAPLLANGQSAVWFPLNWLYLLAPFELIWTFLVVIQPVIAACGMYLLCRSYVKNQWASFLPALAYGFSAWMSVWNQWNIHGFTYALLPFVLYSIKQKLTFTSIILTSLIIFAGHPQIAAIALTASAIFAALQKHLRWLLKVLAVTLVITSIQWLPTLRYFNQASREKPSSEFVYQKTLLPWKQLLQLVAPNVLGNPATGNFSGSANFVETTGYVGIALVFFALLGLSQRQSGRFPLAILLLSLVLALPNPVSLAIGKLNIPILSTSVASRWLMLLPLALSLLAVKGINRFIQVKKRIPRWPAVAILIIFTGLWLWALAGNSSPYLVARRNLAIPTGIVILLATTIPLTSPKRLIFTRLIPARTNLNKWLLLTIGLATMFELIRFGHKTVVYTEPQFIYPTTPVTKKLQELSQDYSRFAGSEGSVIESNFATRFGLFDLAGYDALYPRRIGELVWAAHYGGQPITDFSRSTVVTPTTPGTARDNLLDLTGVRWLIHKDDNLPQHPGPNTSLFPSDRYRLVWEGNKWQIYENLNAFPRAFFLTDNLFIGEGKTIIKKSLTSLSPSKAEGLITPAQIITYQPTQITINVNAPSNGFLILTDTFYPGWQATVDGQRSKILPAFHAFRAVPVTPGPHIVKFKYKSL